MEPRILPDGSKEAPPLMCPILTAAVTVSSGVSQSLSMQERLKGSGLVAPPSGTGPTQLIGAPCIQDKCGFWHKDLGACGVASVAHMINVVGGNMMEKFFGGADGSKPA